MSESQSAAFGRILSNHRNTAVRWLVGLFVLAVVAQASAQNLVGNPDLASALGPWIQESSTAPDPPASGEVYWTAAVNDDNAMDGTGSAWVHLNATPGQPANAAIGIRQCITLPSGPVAVSSTSFGIHVLTPATGNPIDGLADAVVEVRFFTDSSCVAFISGAGGSQGTWLAPGALSDSLWHEIGDADFALPVTHQGTPIAASAELRAFVRTAGSTDSGYTAAFDHAWLYVNTIFVDGFETGDTSQWSAHTSRLSGGGQ